MDNNIPCVSVIIPVYLVEQYVEKSVRSLFEQSLIDIEYIFVDDCSTDASMIIVERLIDEYSDVRQKVKILKTPKNVGQAFVRQMAIKVASGEYIIHCDSDDWVDVSLYESMYHKAKAGDYDIVLCDMEEINGKNIRNRVWADDCSLISAILMDGRGSLCDKLVKSSIVHDPSIVFPKDDMAEDLSLVLQYASKAIKYTCLRGPMYHYCRRPGSKLGDFSYSAIVGRKREMERNFRIAIEFLDKTGCYDDHEEEIIHECLYIRNMLLSVAYKKGVRKEWKSTFPEITFARIIFSNLYSIKEKANYLSMAVGLYPLYARIKHTRAIKL